MYGGWLKGWELCLDSGTWGVKVVTFLYQFMKFL